MSWREYVDDLRSLYHEDCRAFLWAILDMAVLAPFFGAQWALRKIGRPFAEVSEA